MATWVQTVNTPDGFRAEVSQGPRGRARYWHRELVVQKGEMTTGRILRVGRGYSRTAALCHPMSGLPQLGAAIMSDAKGLSRLARASLYHNPRRGKCPTGAKGKDLQLLYSVITGCSRRL